MPVVQSLFLAAFLFHFLWVMMLYAALTIVRARDVKAGTTTLQGYVRDDGDSVLGDRLRRNIANQFELPLFAYFAAAVLMAMDAVGWLDVVAAWLFLAGRVLHTLVQTMTENVVARGQIYLLTAAAIMILMGHLAVLTIGLGTP